MQYTIFFNNKISQCANSPKKVVVGDEIKGIQLVVNQCYVGKTKQQKSICIICEFDTDMLTPFM